MKENESQASNRKYLSASIISRGIVKKRDIKILVRPDEEKLYLTSVGAGANGSIIVTYYKSNPNYYSAFGRRYAIALDRNLRRIAGPAAIQGEQINPDSTSYAGPCYTYEVDRINTLLIQIDNVLASVNTAFLSIEFLDNRLRRRKIYSEPVTTRNYGAESNIPLKSVDCGGFVLVAFIKDYSVTNSRSFIHLLKIDKKTGRILNRKIITSAPYSDIIELLRLSNMGTKRAIINAKTGTPRSAAKAWIVDI